MWLELYSDQDLILPSAGTPLSSCLNWQSGLRLTVLSARLSARLLASKAEGASPAPDEESDPPDAAAQTSAPNSLLGREDPWGRVNKLAGSQ